MAATTLAAILDRFQAVLAAAPLSLKQSLEAFSHDRQPNANIQDTFWVEDGGQASRRSTTNHSEARIDVLRVYVAKPKAFAGLTQMEALVTLGDTMYRHLLVDALTQGWNVEMAAHKTSSPANTDLVIGSYDFRVDYDFSSAV